MPIDIELLKQAWPEGYLGIRGVQTHTKRWQCTRVVPGGWTTFDDPNEYHGLMVRGDEVRYRGNLISLGDYRGQLLPNVDPADTATWACLLQDLAQAAGAKDLYSVRWRRSTRGSNWCLRWGNKVNEGIIAPDLKQWFDLETDDPALALVLARIQLREASPVLVSPVLAPTKDLD